MAAGENNEQKLDESLALLDEARDIPIYKAAENLAALTRMKDYYDQYQGGAQQFNQMIGDMASSAYNLVGVPLNLIGERFGYSPGFSGEKVMQDWFGWSGYKPRGDVDAPLGIETDRSPFREQPLGELVKAYLDKNIAAPDTTTNLASKDVNVGKSPTNISDERSSLLEEFWTFPKERRDRLMASMGDETKSELSLFRPADFEDTEGRYNLVARVE